jgi:hypothetical protein
MRIVDWKLGAAAALLWLGAAACAGSGGLPSLGGGSAWTGTEGRTVSGLKEALEIGTKNAVARTSAADGFLGNDLIRIRLPESLETMAKGLRAVGFGQQVDELEVAMNRAAERAAGEATDVFWDGIKMMSFADAQAILTGGDTAATEYFERTTREPLRTRFQPIVADKMNEVGLVRQYDALVARYTALPFTSKPNLDLRSYVTDKALDGLFTVLGEEERKIRTDPLARVTPLLQEVFGGTSG